jgi:lysophospholipid acyltransferase
MIASILQVISRQVRRTVRPLFLTVDLKPKKYYKTFYDVCTWIASMGLLNMLVPCFDLLHVPKILQVWREIYYCHFIIIAIGGIIFFTSKPYLISIQKQRIRKYEQLEKSKEKDEVLLVESLDVKKNI